LNGEDAAMRGGRIVAVGMMAVVIGAMPWLGAQADDAAPIGVTIKDHKFSPAEIHVPAGKPTTLKISNEDPTAEEFDSTALQVEKVIVGGTWGLVHLRPLAPGKYPFMGEYHSDTAQGVVISQ
jgi:plastocyanin